MLIEFNSSSPELGKEVFIAQNAVVIGDVSIGDNSSIWFNSVVRGDVHFIRIGSRTNIQDSSVLHVRKGQNPLIIGDEVTIGHRVVAHGCTINSKTLIGIGSIILDGAVIQENSIIAAGSLVPPGFVVPSGKLAIGSPCKIKRDLSETEIESIRILSSNYVGYSKDYLNI